jgi:tetratricopeptide (TPR) repeat protein
VDVFPTIALAVGGEAPTGLTGMSLLSGSQGTMAGRRVYSESVYPRFHFGWNDLASLVDERFHYIHASRPELFDWVADPAEKKDLARDLSAPFRAMRVALLGIDRPLNAPASSDPEAVKKLASLGYISVTSAGVTATDLPDPKDRIAALARLKEASRLSAQGHFDQAVGLLRELVRESPRMLVGREALALVLGQAGRPAEALEALLEADRLMPGVPQIILGVADLALENGDIVRARSYARAAAAVGEPGAVLILAKTALAAKDYEGARREAHAALEADEGSRAGWLLLASIEEEAGNLPAAWEALEHVRQLGAQGERGPLENYQFLRGDVLARMGRNGEAEAAFREETETFPENHRGWTGLALLSASEGRPEEAGRVLRDMISKSPRPGSYYAAARTYEVLGDRPSAARLRRKAQDLFPGARELRSSTTPGRP